MSLTRLFGVLGALCLFLGVGLGAFAAHGLEGSISSSSLETWQTGVRYQLLHGLGLLVAAWLATQSRVSAVRLAGLCFASGVVLFSGSLYGLALGGPRWLGPVTPFGGLAFLVGWLALAWAYYRLPGAG